jgi:hypothetical protein
MENQVKTIQKQIKIVKGTKKEAQPYVPCKPMFGM